jgi:hypothetical protein
MVNKFLLEFATRSGNSQKHPFIVWLPRLLSADRRNSPRHSILMFAALMIGHQRSASAF